MIRARTRTETVPSIARVPLAARTRTTVATTATIARTIVRRREPGKMIGFPLIRPWSLPEAISEPVNVTEPITTSSTVKIVVETLAVWPPAAIRTKSSIATSAAAPPPTALKSDTSCGIAVIFTVRAV